MFKTPNQWLGSVLSLSPHAAAFEIWKAVARPLCVKGSQNKDQLQILSLLRRSLPPTVVAHPQPVDQAAQQRERFTALNSSPRGENMGDLSMTLPALGSESPLQRELPGENDSRPLEHAVGRLARRLDFPIERIIMKESGDDLF